MLLTTFDHGRPLLVSLATVALVGLGGLVAGAVAVYHAKAFFELSREASKERDANGWGDAALEVAVDMDAVAALVQLGFAKESAQQEVVQVRRLGLVPRSADASELLGAILERRRNRSR